MVVMITHDEAKAAYNHVMDNVLGKDDSSGLKKALVGAGIENVFDLVNVDKTTIDNLVYDKSDTETNVPVARGDKNLVQVFQDFVIHRYSSSTPIGDAWLKITPEDFDGFRMDLDYLVQQHNRSTVNSPGPTATTHTSPTSISATRSICGTPSYVDAVGTRIEDSTHDSTCGIVTTCSTDMTSHVDVTAKNMKVEDEEIEICFTPRFQATTVTPSSSNTTSLFLAAWDTKPSSKG